MVHINAFLEKSIITDMFRVKTLKGYLVNTKKGVGMFVYEASHKILNFRFDRDILILGV